MIDIELIETIMSKLKFKFPYASDDFLENLYFEDYHCHKDFSNTCVADSGESIESYVKRVKELKAKCLYSGEHGSQGNQFYVYNVAEKEGLKYRHSAEVYWVKNRLEKDRTNCHMVVVAKNAEGRGDINYALSMANIDGYYYRPRIDLDLLFKIPKDNVIVTSACFTKNMMVQTSSGYKYINNIKKGDKILSHKGTWENVITPTQRYYNGKLFSLNVEGCATEIQCTDNHKFPTVQKTHNNITKNIIWKQANELTINDRILSVIDESYEDIKQIDFSNIIEEINNKNDRKRKHIKNNVIEINNKFLELLGIYTAEGSLNNTNEDGITFTLNLKDTMICEKVINYSKEIFGIEPEVRIRKEFTRMDVRLGSTEIYGIFKSLFSSGAKNKTIPDFILKLNPKLQMQFIKGLFNGDGHLTKKEPKITYCTISKILSLQVIDILERNDIKVAAHCSSEFTDKNNIHHNEAYIIDINKKEFRDFWNRFCVDDSDYTFDWINTIKWNSKKPIIIDGVKYHHKKIMNITNNDYVGMVYCLNVENIHSFKCESISVHNCIAGWNYDDAEEIWLKIHDYFGDNFFFEVQANNTNKQKKLNKKIIELSKKYGIQIIAGLDSHYISDEGCIKRDQILKYKDISYPEEDGWYMDYPDAKTLIARFQEQGILSDEEILTAIMNTNVFVSECEDIVLDRHFKIPSVHKNKTYEEKCKIYKHILNVQYAKEKLKSKEKADGIRYEAKEVMDSGVVDYFLTTRALIDKAVNEYGGILTTTSRGSAASFITNKLLGITTVDRFNSDIPIYPERFLTKERVLAGQMPDCDLNIAEQEPFIKAAKYFLGEHGCYPLMAVEKLKVKAAWQLYAGANDVKPEDANQISKYITQYEEKLKYADDEDKDLIHVEDFIPDEYLSLFKQSNDYQGITINLKVHACGNLIFDGDIRREIGLISAISKTTKKRTICACVEGNVLDDFGYVKEDFLIVDSVHLTYKCFKSIGMEVPTFDELRKMIDGDKKTWEIYEKGITCCINQCEKESTTHKVMKYKPTTLAELSAFIAAIRPGFATLLSTFINRESYSTGEPKIDELLKDTSHFMIYQESIMKVLSFLKLAMGDTYGVIKSISKKKLKGEKKEHLLSQLNSAWEDEFGNINNFNNVWHVIEDSARYAFNSPHAYSMGGDSAYLAWFKAHHTEKFYEVAINHYQSKEKKDKIDSLVKEIIKFYGYKLGGYEFGKDNRTVTLDTTNKIIYPNLSSVKNFGDNIPNTLYQLGQNKYDSFIDLLNDLSENSINKSRVDDLIRLDYFKEFGDINTLLQIVNINESIGSAKQINKDKIAKLGLDESIIKKYGNETEKMYTKLQADKIVFDMIANIQYKPFTLKDRLDAQHDILGILTEIDQKANKRLYYVSNLDVKVSIVNIKLHEIYSGKTREVKMWTNQFNRQPFKETNVLYISTLEKKNKKEPTGEINPNTGKKIYRDIEGKFEFWLSRYSIKNDIEEGEEY